jgi:hypothetical protein
MVNPQQGYGNWTKTVKKYAPIVDNIPLTYPKSNEDVKDIEMPFWRRITDPVWVERYLQLLVHLEKDERSHEMAMRSCNCFFINLFRNFGPVALEPWKKWVEEWCVHREARYQRVAISIWAAAMTCHNHWPAKEAFEIQKWCVKILHSAICKKLIFICLKFIYPNFYESFKGFYSLVGFLNLNLHYRFFQFVIFLIFQIP